MKFKKIGEQIKSGKLPQPMGISPCAKIERYFVALKCYAGYGLSLKLNQ
jgi:hypothetical protein